MVLCNAVFEGGGVKGIGHVGAISYLEKKGYRFNKVVGSSAGAIVASLLSAGYTSKELYDLMKSVDYMKFLKESKMDKIPWVGKLMSMVWNYGIYDTSYLEQWLHKLLKAKGITTFQDVKNADGSYRLQITTVDLTTKKLLILPHDLKQFAIHKDSFPIVKAVCMSISIPFFYEPFKLKDIKGNWHYLVDGGLLSNYPIWVLDDGDNKLEYPTFGFRFVDNSSYNNYKINSCESIIDYCKLNVETLLNAADKVHISYSKGDKERTILIPSIMEDGSYIASTDFNISSKHCFNLYENGYQSAKQFLKNWNFQAWQKKYRSQ